MGLGLSLTFTLTVLSLLMGILGNFLVEFAKEANRSLSELKRARDGGDITNEERYRNETMGNVITVVIILIVIASMCYFLLGAGSVAMLIDENPKINLSANLTCDESQYCSGFVTNTQPLSCECNTNKSSEKTVETVRVVYVNRSNCSSDIGGFIQLVNSRNIKGL